MDLRTWSSSILSLVVALPLMAPFHSVMAQTAPTWGTAQSFAILGSSAVTNTGPTIINGDLGVSPGTAIVGFPPGLVNGTTHAANAVAAQARTDANTAYNSLAGQPCNTILTGQDLGGLTLTPGVYCYASTAQLTGTLTLDAQGDPNAVFIFKIGSSLTTASSSSVLLVNGASPCNVFFQVGSSATLGTGTQFIGNIVALASVTLTTNVGMAGRAIGLNGAVTLDSNVVSVPTCSGVPATGSVQVCKVAGAGVVAGTNYSFNVGGIPITVPAGAAPGGSCSTAVVVAPGPVVITETVPAGTAVTGVSTLPSAGLLISSNLSAGTATVMVTAGGQTTVTFINAAVPTPPSGLIQVCKVAGAGVTAGTNFTFNVAGTTVTVAAGAAPGGTCGSPVSVPPGAAVVTETIPAGFLLAGVSTLPTAGLLVSSNLAAGTATVTVLAGGQTIVTFIDTAIPVSPTLGFLQVCKVAGSGITVGTNFSFNVAGSPVTIAAGPAPGGSCGTPVSLPAGPAIVTETIPAGTLLAGVSTTPSAGLLVSSNLAAGTATVTVLAGSQTTVTFIDAKTPTVPANGFVQVCKVAGAGVAVGASFNFNVAGTAVVLTAGLAPGGTCATPVELPAGTAVITETIPAGAALTGVSTLPAAGLLISSNLGAGTATVTVVAGGQTIVTFVNAVVPVLANGFVQVCKVAGAGVTVGTNFTFNVAGTSVTVPAGPAPNGSCGTPVAVPAGVALITETIPGGFLLAGVSTLPAAGLLIGSNLAAGTATVTVLPGGQTIVTFIDAAIPVSPGSGYLQVCKVAGAGITVGTNFTFNVGGTLVTVPAGLAPGGSCGTPVAVPAGTAIVTETAVAGTAVAGISVLPGTGLLITSNLSGRTATVSVLAGAQTIVIFVNAVPTTGFIQVCKVAGPGVIVGTKFTFNIAGATVIVPAGATPGSSCSPALVAAIGPAVITEALTFNPDAQFHVRYAANLDTGDSYINFINDGSQISAQSDGTFCANVYTLDPNGGLLSCCACPIRPNGLNSLSVRSDLINNTLTPFVQPSVQIGLIASKLPPGGICNPAAPTGPSLVRGLSVWGTTLHAMNTTVPSTYQTTETPFSLATLGGTRLMAVSTSPSTSLLIRSDLALGSAVVTVTPGGQTVVTFTNTSTPSVLSRLTTLCLFLQANGSGYGICNACRLGGLGAKAR